MYGQLNAKAYKTRIKEFQKYIQDIPSDSHNQAGQKPSKFTELELRYMLVNAVSEAQENKLISQGWRITAENWNKTLDKLENLKPQIEKDETIRK